jgi:LL-diaminopimelate aminotransferase
MKFQLECSKLEFFRPDAFGFINNLKTQSSRYPMINLSIGAPNRPTPEWILESMKANLDNPAYHTYPPQHGAPELCDAIAFWYRKRFKVKLDPRDNVLVTVGIKEAIFNALHSLINAGDTVLVPDPGYPTYFEAVLFTGGKLVTYNSDSEPAAVLNEIEYRAKTYNPKIVVVNYPSNPTGRIADADFYNSLSEIAAHYGFIVMSDLAYSEIAFDGLKVSSYLEARPNLELGFEYFAFSKTYNMAGWRVGAIVGDKRLVDAVKLYKSKIDSNVFYPIQLAAATALKETPASFYHELSAMYENRRNALLEGLSKAGLKFSPPQGAMYTWVETPMGMDPWVFTEKLYREYGILVVPGTAYGLNGIKRVRIGLVQEVPLMEEAAQRLTGGGLL